MAAIQALVDVVRRPRRAVAAMAVLMVTLVMVAMSVADAESTARDRDDDYSSSTHGLMELVEEPVGIFIGGSDGKSNCFVEYTMQ